MPIGWQGVYVDGYVLPQSMWFPGGEGPWGFDRNKIDVRILTSPSGAPFRIHFKSPPKMVFLPFVMSVTCEKVLSPKRVYQMLVRILV